MLVKPFKRLIAFTCPLLIIIYFVFAFDNKNNGFRAGYTLTRRLSNKKQVAFQSILEDSLALPSDELDLKDDAIVNALYSDDEDDDNSVSGPDDKLSSVNTDMLPGSNARHDNARVEGDDEHSDYEPLPDGPDYREIFSLSTKNRKYTPIYTGALNIYNPNIIPHPTQHDLWIVVAQHGQSARQASISEQLVCSAGFLDDFMVCTADPTVLPVEPSIPGRCEDALSYFNFRSGPRDARMFYGPDAPLLVYGSQSAHTCLSIWIQDVRMLLQEFRLEQFTLTKLFEKTTEVQRPPPIKGIEKNFFLFWGGEGKAYVHHDIFPRRVFAQLSYDGSVGPDLAPLASNDDSVCLAMYMPSLGPQEESIHQATNSLAITLCKRSDPQCIVNDENTFIMTVFQHKTCSSGHCIYEPYVTLFGRNAPFAIHGISQRPLWIHGRAPLTKESHSMRYDNDPTRPIPEGHTEMFYVTSISWKTHGQKYHGYIDDPIFLAFGIEDSRAGVIDVLAEDLVQDLGLCTY